MADVSKIKAIDGTAYNIKDASSREQLSLSTLTITRTANDYVNTANFNRLFAYRRGNGLFANFNLRLNSNSAMTDFIEIGRITGWYSAVDIYQSVNEQESSSGTPCVIKISSTGIISMYCKQPVNSGWYRCSLATAFSHT